MPRPISPSAAHLAAGNSDALAHRDRIKQEVERLRSEDCPEQADRLEAFLAEATDAEVVEFGEQVTSMIYALRFRDELHDCLNRFFAKQQKEPRL